MSEHTPLDNPSKLLRDIRKGFIDAGGSAEAFDWAVNEHVAQRVAAERSRCAKVATDLAWLYQSPVFTGQMVANSMLLECATKIRAGADPGDADSAVGKWVF
jgi:hypothetical protein